MRVVRCDEQQQWNAYRKICTNNNGDNDNQPAPALAPMQIGMARLSSCSIYGTSDVQFSFTFLHSACFCSGSSEFAYAAAYLQLDKWWKIQTNGHTSTIRCNVLLFGTFRQSTRCYDNGRERKENIPKCNLLAIFIVRLIDSDKIQFYFPISMGR